MWFELVGTNDMNKLTVVLLRWRGSKGGAIAVGEREQPSRAVRPGWSSSRHDVPPLPPAPHTATGYHIMNIRPATVQDLTGMQNANLHNLPEVSPSPLPPLVSQLTP